MFSRLIAVIAVAALACMPMAARAQAATDLVLVIDNSGSMRQNDPAFLARTAVSTFIDNLGGDTRLGLIIFAEGVDYAVPMAPLGDETRRALTAALERINYRGQRTNSPSAIERAIYELKTNARPGAARAIVFMTDGIVDTGNAALDVDRTRWLRDELTADAAAENIRMFAVAFTDNADFFLIQSLAQKTGGEYFRAPNASDLPGVFAAINSTLAAPPAALAPVVPAPPPAAAPAVAVTGPAPVTEPAPPPEAAEAAPAPAETAPAAAAGGVELSEEERRLFEEAGIRPEDLTELQPGQAIIVRPAEDTGSLGVAALLLAVAVIGLLLVAVGLYMKLKRQRGAGATAGAATAAAPAAAPQPPDAYLLDVDEVTGQRTYSVGDKPLMIGRVAGTDAEHLEYVVVNKPTVGRRHALIKYKDFGFWVIDQGSVNGTFINGTRLVGERQLRHGDVIKFHKYEFRFEVPAWSHGGGPSNREADATLVANADATMQATASSLKAARSVVRAAPAALATGAVAAAPKVSGTPDIDLAEAAAALEELDATAQDDDTLGAGAAEAPALPPEADEEPDEMGDEDYGVEINLDVAGEPAPAAADSVGMDTDASAFFDDALLPEQAAAGSGDAQDMFGMDEAPPAAASPPPFTSTEVGPAEELVRTTMVGPSDELQEFKFPDEDANVHGTVRMVPAAAPDQADFGGLDTIVRDEGAPDAGQATGQFDAALDSFLSTSAFDKTKPPVQDEGPLDISMTEFMSTAEIDSAPRAEPEFPEEPEAWATGEDVDASDMFDISGEAEDKTLLPSQVPDKPGGKRG